VGRSEAAMLPELEPRTDGRTPQPHGTRRVHRPSGESLDYGLYLRDDLTAGDRVTGPAIISEHTATTVLHAGDTAEIGSYGELVITIGDRANREA
jgi:N-methylhydantoinase A